jgi:hypothetical protein
VVTGILFFSVFAYAVSAAIAGDDAPLLRSLGLPFGLLGRAIWQRRAFWLPVIALLAVLLFVALLVGFYAAVGWAAAVLYRSEPMLLVIGLLVAILFRVSVKRNSGAEK